MQFAAQRPGPPLEPFVEHITYFEGYMPAHQREKIVPDGAIQIIVDLHDRPKHKFDSETGAGGRGFTRSWIAGMQMAPIVIEAQQRASLLIIRFRPGGARPFLRFSSEGLNGLVEPFEDVLDRAALELRERVLEGATAAAKLASAEAWLIGRIEDFSGPPPVIAHIAARRFAPDLQVAHLADELGYSTRQLRNLFHAWVGLGPKQFLQVSRFRQVIAHLAASGSTAPDWAALAPEFGYADQPHLTHDFRRFAGMSPGRFVARYRGQENFLPIHVPQDLSADPKLPIFARPGEPGPA